MMQRIQSARELLISRTLPRRWRIPHPLLAEDLEVLRQTVKAMVRASRHYKNLTTLVDSVIFHLPCLTSQSWWSSWVLILFTMLRLDPEALCLICDIL